MNTITMRSCTSTACPRHRRMESPLRLSTPSFGCATESLSGRRSLFTTSTPSKGRVTTAWPPHRSTTRSGDLQSGIRQLPLLPLRPLQLLRQEGTIVMHAALALMTCLEAEQRLQLMPLCEVRSGLTGKSQAVASVTITAVAVEFLIMTRAEV